MATTVYVSNKNKYVAYLFQFGRDIDDSVSYLGENVQYYPASSHKAAITMVVHGLNVKPTAMEPLIHWLTSSGSAVYLIQLSGHIEKSATIRDIDPYVWKDEMLDGFNTAKAAAAEHGLPLYFLGYSLGALLGQSMLALVLKEKCFEKQILISPAIAVRFRSSLLRLLFLMGDQIALPSLAPQAYRVNDVLPLRVYQLLFAEEKKVWKAMSSQLNIPTLVIIDPKDELISYRKLLRFIKKYELTNYQVLSLDSRLGDRRGGYHHLLLDQRTMGVNNWNMAIAAMQQFFF